MQTDNSSAENASAVTLSDTAVVRARALWVGTGGNLKLTIGGTAVTLKNIASGTLIPVRDPIVWTTGSTAADVVALY